MSRINCVYPYAASASVEPSMFGTIAMFDVMNPSEAFKVATTGGGC